MVTAKLVGTPNCRRYQRMRQRLMQAAGQLKIEVTLIEETATDELVHYNPLSLPLLFVAGQQVASRNAPTLDELGEQLNAAIKNLAG